MVIQKKGENWFCIPRPAIHLWIYNHRFHGIGDQADFFLSSFRQHGYRVSLGRQPRETALNLVIEGFSTETRNRLTEFCRRTGKKVGIILTEHMDFIDGRILFHGEPLGSENDYMHPATQMSRVRNLMECVPWIRCFLVLGDLPYLKNISTMFPGIEVRNIPFPVLDPVPLEDQAAHSSVVRDLVFTGAITDYRSDLLALLQQHSFSLDYPRTFVSRIQRNRRNRSARVILNLPQRTDWRWLSLMRILGGLRCGRATVSIGTRDDSQISACCRQLDIRESTWVEELREWIRHWPSLYRTALDQYLQMTEKFYLIHGFPHDLFILWTVTDRLTRPN